MSAAKPVFPRTVTNLDQAATEEAQQRDGTATRAFSNIQITTSDGRCLFVDKLSGDFRENLTPVQIAACGSTDGQGWDIITAGEHINTANSMLLVNTLTQACLNFDSRRAAGNQVILFSCGGRADGGGTATTSQAFSFNGTAGPISFKPENAAGSCLTSLGDVVDVADCDFSDPNQVFAFGGAAAATATSDASAQTSSVLSAIPSVRSSATTFTALFMFATTTSTAGSEEATITATASTSTSASVPPQSASLSTAAAIAIPTTAVSVGRGGNFDLTAALEANLRDANATKAFTNVEIRAPNGQCLFVDPTAGDFRENLIPVSLVDCSGTPNEKWDVITAGQHNDAENAALIVSSLTNGCISFDGRRSANDTVNLFSCGGRADGYQLMPFTGALSFAFSPTGENGAVCILPGDGRLISGTSYSTHAKPSGSQNPASDLSDTSVPVPAYNRHSITVSTTAVDRGAKPSDMAEAPSSASQTARQSGWNTMSPTSPGVPEMRRRATRTVTFRNVDDFAGYAGRPGWQPGSEPGIDTTKPDGGRETLAHMKAPSDITVVDFSQSDMSTTRLDNSSLAGFLAIPQAANMKCRWINVNGLSWDVIQILGNHKKLHRLAIEDLMNTRNRTKADWYPTHTYLVLVLLKLVHTDGAQKQEEGDNDGNDGEDDGKSWISKGSSRWRRKVSETLKTLFGEPGEGYDVADSPVAVPAKVLENGQQLRLQRSTSTATKLLHINEFRTLQRYRASPNDARTEFMESHSVLSSQKLAVAAEQVSVFITDDNTVISFFELSAEDVEEPILNRLVVPDTTLRRSCDASMLAQAILDAIIDLAIPLTVCYGDVIADLELDVLTRPSVSHTKSLYITITEVNKVLSFINPIMNLINTLRDHKTEGVGPDDMQDPRKGVIISPTTYVYLADVLDHCVLITEALEQVKGQAENMISLIFNTISAYQNESMKQLTIVTIIFLPLTFLTGYFGQNFDGFSDLKRGIPFFWEIAGPVIFFTIIIMMRQMIMESLATLVQRHHIGNLRKHHRKHKHRT
ncbi:Mg2+ transporter protein [Grosmannia clavigera kw1407]|uniref:Mg2+ transporter protein n=1 Tax=Grosmannia clavigera (strain kw1407 / UAMH 11150) TaxID=655863 RepID=F0XR14_GROCL|nr:Mg2+ transporter protein [Grosmannia clavigera kw1407]EFW99783.1 Mg2+ transporter protein [Grosmannia clavigera kw1407]